MSILKAEILGTWWREGSRLIQEMKMFTINAATYYFYIDEMCKQSLTTSAVPFNSPLLWPRLLGNMIQAPTFTSAPSVAFQMDIAG
jgi:hypothetical protein